jgi:hypothetical protein
MNTAPFLKLPRSLNADIKEGCTAAIGVQINLLCGNEITKIINRFLKVLFMHGYEDYNHVMRRNGRHHFYRSCNIITKLLYNPV